MQHDVTQLLEMLEEAKRNCPAPLYLELPEDINEVEMSMAEEGQTIESIFGIEQTCLPPENSLSDEQIRLLIDGITDLWHEFHYDPVFRRGEFTEREQYTKLVNYWKETVPLVKYVYSTLHIEMYDYENYWDEDEQRYLTDEEYWIKFPPPKLENFKLEKN